MNLIRYTGGLLAIAVLSAAIVGTRVVLADSGHDHGAGTPKAQAKQPAEADKEDKIPSAPYPLDTCPVTGEKLGEMGEPVVYDYQGREIKFCCAPCIEEFEADPAKFIAEIDAQIIAKQVKGYPLTTCVVTDEPLGGEMGEPFDLVYKNRLVRFCCEGCVDSFNEDPAPFLAKIDAAAEAQTAKAKAAK